MSVERKARARSRRVGERPKTAGSRHGDAIFRPIVESRAHDHVIDQITFGIRSGVHKVGERLPYIGELARQLGVSKPTVGEGIRILAEHGVVKSQRGVTGGVTVISDDIPTALLGLAPDRRQTDLRQLLEARRAVEMELARLASRRASEADIENMRESVERLRHHVGSDRRLQLHYDHLFHYAMGRAARSDLLAYYQHQILKRLVVLLHDYFFHEEDPELVIELHERTLDAVASGDEAVVDSVMDEHLRVLERAVAARATPASDSASA